MIDVSQLVAEDTDVIVTKMLKYYDNTYLSLQFNSKSLFLLRDCKLIAYLFGGLSLQFQGNEELDALDAKVANLCIKSMKDTNGPLPIRKLVARDDAKTAIIKGCRKSEYNKIFDSDDNLVDMSNTELNGCRCDVLFNLNAVIAKGYIQTILTVKQLKIIEKPNPVIPRFGHCDLPQDRLDSVADSHWYSEKH